MRENFSFYLTRILLVIVLLWGVWEAGISIKNFTHNAATSISFPYPLNIIEGYVLDQTLHLAHFENIYHTDPSKPPYTLSQYPPLYMLIQVPFVWAFGPALWYSRMISVVSLIFTALLISMTIFTLTRERIGALSGGVLLIAFPYNQLWSMYNRIDSLALLLSWSAIFVIVKYVGPTDDRILPKWGFPLAVSLLVACIFTRQTYALAAPLTSFTWLLFGTYGSKKSRLRLALKLGLTVGILTFVIFTGLNVITRGGFFLNIVTANINEFFWERVFFYAKEIGRTFYPILLITGLFVLHMIIRGNSKIWALVLPYLLASATVSLTIGKEGSDINYLLEFCAALSLSAGFAVASISEIKNQPKTWLRIAVFGILVFQISIMTEFTRKHPITGNLYYRLANFEKIEKMRALVKKVPGIVLADEYMGLIPLAGKQLYCEPGEFRHMSDAKNAAEKSFLNDIRNRKFDLILLGMPINTYRWSPQELSVIESNYRFEAAIAEVAVLRPIK